MNSIIKILMEDLKVIYMLILNVLIIKLKFKKLKIWIMDNINLNEYLISEEKLINYLSIRKK